MTIAEAIRRCDELLPNRFKLEQKVKWIARVEGELYRDIIATHANPGIKPPIINEDTDCDTQLIAQEPYDELYVLYLQAMIHYENMEITKYNNAKTLYNDTRLSFRDWWNRHFLPDRRVPTYQFGKPLPHMPGPHGHHHHMPVPHPPTPEDLRKAILGANKAEVDARAAIDRLNRMLATGEWAEVNYDKIVKIIGFKPSDDNETQRIKDQLQRMASGVDLLTAGKNINFLVDHGIWYVQNILRPVNVPVYIDGFLIVIRTREANFVFQIYEAEDGSRYTRSSSNNGEDWCDWIDVTVRPITAQSVRSALGYTPADAAVLQDLSAKVDGYMFTFEETSDAAYALTVPRKAMKYALLDKVGAKSVVWNQLLRDPEIVNIGSYGVTANVGRTLEDGVLTAKINNSNCQVYQADHTKTEGHKYYMSFEVMPTNGWFAYCGLHNNVEAVERVYTEDGVWNRVSQVRTFTPGTGPDQFGFYLYFNSNDPSNQIKFRNPIVCDLTEMFGAGNEPGAKAFELMFPEDRYAEAAAALRNYEPKKIKCIGTDGTNGKTIDLTEIIGKYFPDGMKSVGNVHDEIDLENGKAIKRVKCVDLGTLTWTKPLNSVRFYAPIEDPYVFNMNDVPQNVICAIGETIPFNALNTGGGRGVALTSTKNFNVSMPQYDSMTAEQFKAAVSGVKMYYVMAEREDVDITETLDRELIVEPDGKIVFESAYSDAHMLLPYALTFMIKL